jgi:hypothetical protein
MDEKKMPVFAGLGGAALVAAVMTVGGSSSSPPPSSQLPKPAVVASAISQIDITSNQDGPWYAFCQEYATTEFDRGEDPVEQRGILGHRVPKEADDGTVEITKEIHFKTGGRATEKFNVRKHTIGDLAGCVPANHKLRVVIALVPDPNATEMRLDFDRDVVAIQSAAAAEHYLYTRFWFPWRPNGWVPDKTDDPEAETKRRQEPGILCFRKDDGHGTTDRLFVLLVGETPTSGSNRIQFSHALYYSEQMTSADRHEVDIAGPHFSASFKAIEDVLAKVQDEQQAELPPKAPQIASFVSPDASGQEFLSEFREFCSRQLAVCKLRTLSLPSNQVKAETLAFLDRLGYESGVVAQWSEDESAFGISLTNPLPRDLSKGQADYGLVLHFPRDLSSVRNLSDQQSAKVAQEGSKYFVLPGESLPTQLAAREPIDRDSPAAYGAEQEAVGVARSLTDSVEQMRRHHIRAVVIGATNPLDRIYLLEYLHDQLPDVRTLTIDADSLELDRPHFVDLRGTMAVTSMPTLMGMSNVIEGPDSIPAARYLSFDSSRQEGEFLAIELLLSGSQLSDLPVATTNCFLFSVVGNHGYQLLPQQNADQSPRFPCAVTQSADATHPDFASAGLPAQYLTIDDHTKPPSVFLTFMGAILLWNVVHIWCVYSALRGVEGAFSYTSRLIPSREPIRFYLLFVINNQLLLLNLIVTRLAYMCFCKLDLSNLFHSPAVFLLLPMALASVLTVCLSFGFLFAFCRSIKNPVIPLERRKLQIFQIVIATLFVCTTAWMVFSLPFLLSKDGTFLERITQLGEGLSPMLPVTAILLGYFLWGWTHLRRLDWAASRKPHLTFSKHLQGTLYSMVDTLQASLDELIPNHDKIQLICTCLSFVAAMVLWDGLSGLEGFGFHLWFVSWGVFMLLLTVAMTCFHAWSIWDRMRKLLDCLEATQMVEAFERLGRDGNLQIKIWDLAKNQKSFKILRCTVESIDRVAGPNSAAAMNAQGELAQLLLADANHRQLQPWQIETCSNTLNVLMDEAVATLSPSITASTTRTQDELRIYLAFRLVALIRYGMLHIGSLICFVAYGFVLAVISVMFYAFEGKKTISELLVLTFIALLVWIGAMMLQFQRNGMLSRLEGSAPGQANYGQVLLHLLTVGGLPLVAVVSSQFPGVANFAYTFFRPLLSALH